WRGGDHGKGTQKTSQTNQCHDITVFPEIGLAAGPDFWARVDALGERRYYAPVDMAGMPE
ncbi:MAG: redoxin domain-containing (seleno)protein, partial [Alphaproteobacteria bacterium]|nr:redoxin domain-containing (seleno)protein [Alphaproteobacteria bacterium]